MGRLSRTGLLVVAFAFALGPLMGAFAPPASAVELGWGPPIRLAEAVRSPVLAADGIGNAISAWTSDGGVWTSRYVPGRGWGIPTLIATDEGAGSPDLAVEPNGKAVLAWRGQGDTIYASMFTPGAGWGNPEPISQPEAFGARVGLDAAGNAIAVWSKGDAWEIWSNRFVQGQGWGMPVRLDREALVCTSWCGYSIRLVVGSSGTAFAIWWDWHNDIWASRYETGAGWRSPQRIADSGPGDLNANIAIDQVGNAMVAWRRDDGFDRVGAIRYVQGSGWEDPSELAGALKGSDGILQSLSTPEVAVDDEGRAIIAWTSYTRDRSTYYPAGDRDLFVARHVPGIGWEGVDRIYSRDDASLDRIRIAAGHAGTVFMTWVSSGDPVKRGAVQQTFTLKFAPEAGWEQPIPFGEPCRRELHSGFARFECNLHSHFVAMGPLGSATLLWARDVDGPVGPLGNDLWASRFVSPASAILELLDLDGALQSTQEALGQTQDDLAHAEDELGVTRGNLANAEEALEATRGILDDSNAKILLLLGLQAVFVASTVILFVLYWNVRGTIPRTGGRAGTLTKRSLLSRLWRRRGHSPKPARENAQSPDGRVFDGARHGWPTSLTDKSLRLTTQERILLHLLDFARNEEGREAPPEVTRLGIVSAAGVNPRHFAQYVRPLVQQELVEKRSAHVEGVLQRRAVYMLTARGMRKALGIRDRVKSAVVRMRDSSGVRNGTIADVLAAVRGSRSILSIICESIESGFVDLRR